MFIVIVFLYECTHQDIVNDMICLSIDMYEYEYTYILNKKYTHVLYKVSTYTSSNFRNSRASSSREGSDNRTA